VTQTTDQLATAVRVTTAQGVVEGRAADGVATFKGIPYAAPPVGPGRFSPPGPAEPWEGVLAAHHPGPTAPQHPSMLEQMLGADDPVIDEDCLRLNVFTPAGDDGACPVMVWIHGGGFLTGTGGIPWYDGANLARRGAVVVTLNYRLGVLGFLHLEDLSDGFAGSGNAGILDQVAALGWVAANIAEFGGDPANVTIFGESAGAMSVGTLLGVPAAHGLFHRAILQSGAGAHVHDAGAATAMARRFLDEVGVDPADAGRLRDLPLGELLEAQQRLTRTMPFEAGLPLQPVVDGTVLPDRPTARVAAGSAAGIDLLVGTTLEEMRMFLAMDPAAGEIDGETLRRRSDALFEPAGRAPDEALEVYRRTRPDEADLDVWTAMLTDHTFRLPAIRLAEAQLAHHDGVWMYLFAYRSPAFGGALGACHALEIPFVWDNLDARGAPLFVGEPTAVTRALARALADAWVSFARGGEPTAEGLPPWPRYDRDRRATLWIDAEGMTVVDDPMGDERRLWQGVTQDVT